MTNAIRATANKMMATEAKPSRATDRVSEFGSGSNGGGESEVALTASVSIGSVDVTNPQVGTPEVRADQPVLRWASGQVRFDPFEAPRR